MNSRKLRFSTQNQYPNGITKYEAQFDQFLKALERLDEVLGMEKSAVVRDSAIQRFEFTFDLAWKVIKTWLHEQRGVYCASPKKCFREAYKQELLEYSDTWLKMTDDRNNVAHMYKEAMAEELYERLPNYLECFQALKSALNEQV